MATRTRRPVNLTLDAEGVADARALAAEQGVPLCRLVDAALAQHVEASTRRGKRPRVRRTTTKGGK